MHSHRRLRHITAAVAASLCAAFAGHVLAPGGAAAQTVPSAPVSAPAASAPTPQEVAATMSGTYQWATDQLVFVPGAGWLVKVVAVAALIGSGLNLWCAAGGAGC